MTANRRCTSERHGARRVRARGIAILCTAVLVACALPALGATPTVSVGSGSPASRLPDAKNASEYWDFIAHLDSGHLVLIRFSITNEGPGDHTAYMIGHVVSPDGSSLQFEKGRKKGRWSLSDDGLHIAIGKNELHLGDPERSLKIDRTGIVIDLRFAPGAAGGAAVESSGEPRSIGKSYWVDLLHTSTPTEGTLFLPGMQAPIDATGRISGTHTWMRKSEPKLNLRRIEFFEVPGERAETNGSRGGAVLYLSDLTSPKGDRSTWLVLERDGEAIYQTDQFEIELRGKHAANLGRRYPVPARLVIKGPDLEGEIQLSSVRTTDNPMDIIPQPLRFLLSFKMDPRRAWMESSFTVRLRERSDEPKVEIRGTGVTAVMYTNPVPRGM